MQSGDPALQSGDPALYAMVYLYLYLFIGVFHLALHFWEGSWRMLKDFQARVCFEPISAYFLAEEFVWFILKASYFFGS